MTSRAVGVPTAAALRCRLRGVRVLSALSVLALSAGLCAAQENRNASAPGSSASPPTVPSPAPATPTAVLDLPLKGDAPATAPGSGSIFFVGTATVVLRYGGFTILTDPNFLHKGEHAHLGYGLKSPRLTDPALPIEKLPPIDFVLLSHYHGDHFDQVVEAKLDKKTPIVSTPHAVRQLRERGFQAAQALDTWQSLEVRKGDERLRVSAMPGRHGPPLVARALPEVMGSMLEFMAPGGQPAWRLYVSGDTLAVDELREIPRRYPDIDLALLHLGGTRVLGVLVTMDAEQGVEALRILQPELAIPIHYDDYPVFKSPLGDFLEAARNAGFADKLKVLRHGETHRFSVAAERLR